MRNYEDVLGEAVRMLHEHGGRREPVTRALKERLAQDRELQHVLLGEEVPDHDPIRSPRLRDKAIEGIHDLIDAALTRLNQSR